MAGSTLSKFFLLFVVVSCSFARQQRGVLQAQFALSGSDSVLQLPTNFVLQYSDELRIDSTRVLIRDLDYWIDNKTAIVTLNIERLRGLFMDSTSHFLTARYQSPPVSLKKEYVLRTLTKRSEPTSAPPTVPRIPPKKRASDDVGGSELQKSGFIARGFQLGTNRDLTLNSGFRMQLAGKLSDDVNIVAALTDQNTPIQPEGNTQSLREVDQVFVEMSTKRNTVTLGDFFLTANEQTAGEFGRLNRKLQGARGVSKVYEIPSAKEYSEITLVGASARGKFHTNQFQGMEGNQGPYRLQGKNGEQRLIVIAGTERVFVEGRQMTRGETNDYTIDYASGEVTFSTRRLITNASRVVVDFEYSDREFTRNLVAASATGLGVGGLFSLNASFTQESDDPDAPVEMELTDSTRAIIASSGANRLNASVSGIRFVGIDSLGRGRGQYALRDTAIGTRSVKILEYAPGDSLALYVAAFSAVAQVPADSAGYFRVGAGKFVFAGMGQGSYLPIQLLPVPELHRQFDVNGVVNLGGDLSFEGEMSSSILNSNRFSSIAGSERSGTASRFTLKFSPKQLNAFGLNLGRLDVRATQRLVQKDFLALDRANEVEFARKWNLQSTQSSDETVREASASIFPSNNITGSFLYGTLERPGDQSSSRLQTEIAAADSSRSKVFFRNEQITATYHAINSLSDWSRTLGTFERRVGFFDASVRYESEKRLARTISVDSLSSGSFGFQEIAPKISLPSIGRMSASAEFQIRSEDSASAGSLSRAFRSITQLYAWQLSEWNSLSSSLILNLRNTNFSDQFKLRGNVDANVLTVRSQSRYTPLQRAIESDVFYEFTSQRSARLERVFIRVVRGTGSYGYVGDTNNNGVPDENEFQLVRFDGDYIVLSLPTDQLYPVVDVKASTRLRFQPSRLLTNSSTSLEKILKAISTETYARVDERSTEPEVRQIYLLNFDKFQNDQTTISGSSQWQQDVHVFENSTELSFRIRLGERRGFTQLVTANERSYSQEKSLRVRSQIVREISNETTILGKVDRVVASRQTNRERDLFGTSFNTDFAYRPDYRTEVGFNVGFSEISDRFSAPNLDAGINEQGIRIVYSFPGVGQLRTEVRREEVLLENLSPFASRPIPFELTNGKVPGQSYLWSVNFDYRITGNLQLTVNYSGRSEGGRDPVHTARAEAKAFF
jgi:hypothetical protein